jgi:hypothetical protein
VPIHSHHGAKGLKPERMREAAEQLVPAVMMDDRLADDGAKPRHAIGEPFGNMAAMKRQIGAAGASWHGDVRPEKVPQNIMRTHLSEKSTMCTNAKVHRGIFGQDKTVKALRPAMSRAATPSMVSLS